MKFQQILLLISFVGVLGATVAPLAPVVQTKQGKMVGIEREFEEEKVHIYQGVRYGKLADFFLPYQSYHHHHHHFQELPNASLVPKWSLPGLERTMQLPFSLPVLSPLITSPPRLTSVEALRPAPAARTASF